MKIRNGFVSNSSSTSFVVGRKYFENVWDLAWQMVALRHWDTDEELIEKLMDKMVRCEKEVDITFSTCNFDTYIHIDGDNFWIGTSNNHYGFFSLFKNKSQIGIVPEYVKQNNSDKWGDRYEHKLCEYIEFYMDDDYDFVKVDKDED